MPRMATGASTAAAHEEERRRRAIRQFLAKPFDLDALLDQVHAALEQPASGGRLGVPPDQGALA
jgi:hypothetical protein